jgi:hypothetical protein
MNNPDFAPFRPLTETKTQTAKEEKGLHGNRV